MAASPYTYVLNLIRQGKSQVDSYAAALRRFSDYAPERVYNQWLSAWTGKYTANLMQQQTGSTLFDYLSTQVSGKAKPPVTASPGEIQPWFSRVLQSPFDMQLVAKVTLGKFEEFGTWRYEMRGSDTYAMIQRTIEGLIVKEYLRGARGKIDVMNSYIIGIPLDI